MSQHPDRKLSRVTRIIFEQPWAITPGGLETIADIVDRHVQGNVSAELLAEITKTPPRTRGKMDVREDVAIVPIQGPLIRKATWFSKMSGATSYEEIRANLEAAAGNDKVRVIVMDVDSPGGEVTGAQDTAELISSIAQESDKLVCAYCDGCMASGAYWLGSQANEVITSQDAIVGSIGVIMKILDASRAERNEGYDMTVLRTGEQKAVGVGPITERQMAPLRDLMDQAFKTFVASVELGRDRKLSDDVLTGRVFVGEQAISEGLVDRFATWGEFMSGI